MGLEAFSYPLPKIRRPSVSRIMVLMATLAGGLMVRVNRVIAQAEDAIPAGIPPVRESLGWTLDYNTVQFAGGNYELSYRKDWGFPVSPTATALEVEEPHIPTEPERRRGVMNKPEVMALLGDQDRMAEFISPQIDSTQHHYYYDRTNPNLRPTSDTTSIQYGISEGYTMTNSCPEAVIYALDGLFAQIYGQEKSFDTIGGILEDFDRDLTYDDGSDGDTTLVSSGAGTRPEGTFPAYENGGQTYPIQNYWLLKTFFAEHYPDVNVDFLQPEGQDIPYETMVYNADVRGYSYNVTNPATVEAIKEVTEQGGVVVLLMARGNYLHYVNVSAVDEDNRLLIQTSFVHDGQLFPDDGTTVDSPTTKNSWDTSAGSAWFDSAELVTYFDSLYWDDGEAIIGYTILPELEDKQQIVKVFGG